MELRQSCRQQSPIFFTYAKYVARMTLVNHREAAGRLMRQVAIRRVSSRLLGKMGIFADLQTWGLLAITRFKTNILRPIKNMSRHIDSRCARRVKGATSMQ
jgi:hypothetical protein